jgi:hypothetical protein
MPSLTPLRAQARRPEELPDDEDWRTIVGRTKKQRRYKRMVEVRVRWRQCAIK